jgi:hypothetical protein
VLEAGQAEIRPEIPGWLEASVEGMEGSGDGE